MNIVKNNRYKFTEEQIEKALFYLLKHKEFDSISIVDICKIANINRSSFYAHYEDVNDLMIKVEQNLSNEIKHIFFNNNELNFSKESFIAYFSHMQKYKDFYSAYLGHQDASNNGFTFITEILPQIPSMFKILEKNYSKDELYYHMTFFGAGITGITKHWLKNNCQETPEQMAGIIQNEYERASKIITK